MDQTEDLASFVVGQLLALKRAQKFVIHRGWWLAVHVRFGDGESALLLLFPAGLFAGRQIAFSIWGIPILLAHRERSLQRQVEWRGMKADHLDYRRIIFVFFARDAMLAHGFFAENFARIYLNRNSKASSVPIAATSKEFGTAVAAARSRRGRGLEARIRKEEVAVWIMARIICSRSTFRPSST
jgi:hypothetical protein